MSVTFNPQRIQTFKSKGGAVRSGSSSHFDYAYRDAEVSLSYSTRGLTGYYSESWGNEEPLNGVLSFISTEAIDLDGEMYSGARYEGRDESGTYYYFFGDTDLGGVYLVAIYVDSGYGVDSLMLLIPAQRTAA